jgi:hypothetical protein
MTTTNIYLCLQSTMQDYMYLWMISYVTCREYKSLRGRRQYIRARTTTSAHD